MAVGVDRTRSVGARESGLSPELSRSGQAMTDNVITDPGVVPYTRIKRSPYYYGSRRHGVALYSFYNHH
jgi:hypothetical protein